MSRAPSGCQNGLPRDGTIDTASTSTTTPLS
jgi:hypothetical protein